MALLTMGWAGAARAENEDAISPEVRSYHLQILATDVIAAGAFVAGDALENKLGATGDVMMVGGAVTYALGAPLVHVAHGNYGRAALSAGLRVVLPIIGANVAAAFSHCDRKQDVIFDDCSVNALAMGFLGGGAAAATLDNLAITPWTMARAETAPAPARTSALSLSPRIVATPDRALFGLGGRF